MTCHWHHLAAKKEKGGFFAQAHDRFLADLVWVMKTYEPDVLAGDFNMGLFAIATALRQKALNVEMVAWFAWNGIRDSGVIAEDPVEADAGGWDVEVKIDSCAIFYCQPCKSVKPTINLETFDSGNLDIYTKGMGFPLRTYISGRAGLMETLAQRRLAPTTVGLVGCVRGKSVRKDRWDKEDYLWTAGGHMPLMAFIGEFSRRSVGALTRREGNMTERQWGPGDWRRSKHMQMLGKGPPPPKKSQRAAWSGWQGGWQQSSSSGAGQSQWQAAPATAGSSQSQWQQASASWQQASSSSGP